MSTIAIIGAAGHIGYASSEAFARAGWTVKAVGRGKRVHEMPAGVTPVQGDAFDRASLTAATAGADVILHAANPPYDKWEMTVLPMMENAIAAAKAHGATLMLPGNIYNFGVEIGLDVAEDAPQIPSTGKARIRIAMEERLARAAREEGVQVIILRAGDFFGGPKGGTWMDMMILKDLKKNTFTWPGPWDMPHAFAYLPDLAQAFVALADKRGTLGRFERFHFAGHTLTGEEMQAAAEAASGRKLKRANVNWMVLKLAGLFMPVVREVIKMSYLWRTAHSLDGSHLEATVGPLPTTPPAKALAEAIAAQNLDGATKLAA
ncbi:oxidoreductase [Zhengella mangrovi]|uniref:Oxidoreductase n=1 Tax=Zhengella mangrovi TaxID=1982044 RepID=A0A2G1QKQ6_9HYPH|nr:NmrA family NAD(P)-binding protein [Zhengella mangrovi]PHP66054.1 oxidoreductase [Zhengella mangrovi]